MEHPFLFVLLLHAMPNAEETPQPKETAKELVRQALTAFQAREYSSAASRYLQAYEIASSHGLPDTAELLYNAGLAFDLAGRCDRAAELLERYLRAATSAGPAGLAERLESARACAPAVLVTTAPAGAMVLVDGEARGRTPIELRLRQGERRVRFELEGHVAIEETWNVPAGGLTEQSRSLEPTAQPLDVALDSLPAESPPPDPGARLAVEISPDPPVRLSTLAWVSGGVGAAGLVSGITLALLARGAVSRRNAELMKPEDEISGRTVLASHDEAVRLSIGAYAAFGVALTGLATGAVLLLLDQNPVVEW